MINSHDLHRPHHTVPTGTVASAPQSPTSPRQTFPKRHHRVRWTIVGVSVVVLIVLGLAGWVAYRAISVINTKKLDGRNVSFFQQLSRIVTSGGDQLQGESEDRVNILLLGYGGPGHDGPYLTDTMMVASIQPSTKQVALISIPRDLVVDIPGYDYRKINSVLSFGRDSKYPGGGEALTVKVVSDVLDIPIQYYARVDFDGFVDVINQVGGVTVTVDTAFSDYQYPDNNYGYDPISFKAGEQTMDGSRALKYARSRKGNNGEGTDFARAKRQQKIIVALKEKLLSLGTLSNPKKMSDILGSIGSHSQTNMEVWEMLRVAKLVGSIAPDSIINKVYDDTADGFLKAATGTGGAFILVPRSGTYADMQFLAQNIFLIHASEQEHASILVANGSNYATLGTHARQALLAMGLDVPKAQSLSSTSIGQTVLVAAQPGTYPKTEQLLSAYARAIGTLDLSNWQNQTSDTTLAQALATPIPVTTNTASSPSTVTPNLVLVLGMDQAKPTATTTTNTTTNKNTNTSTNAANSNTKTTNTSTNTKATNSSTSTNTTNTSTANSNARAANNNASSVINSNSNTSQ